MKATFLQCSIRKVLILGGVLAFSVLGLWTTPSSPAYALAGLHGSCSLSSNSPVLLNGQDATLTVTITNTGSQTFVPDKNLTVTQAYIGTAGSTTLTSPFDEGTAAKLKPGAKVSFTFLQPVSSPTASVVDTVQSSSPVFHCATTLTAGQTTTIAPQTAMWVWSNVLASTTNETKLLNFASSSHVNKLLYYSEGSLNSQSSQLAQFVGMASSHGIGVELLFGEPEWALTANHATAAQFVQQSVAFTESLPMNEKPVGVTFDVEPQSLPEWSSDQAGTANQLIDLYNQLETTAQGIISVGADYQMAFDTFSLTRNGATQTMSDWVISSVNEPVLMDYRNTANAGNGDNIESHGSPSVTYASSVYKPVLLGLETNNVSPAKITFCGLGTSALQSAMNSIQSYYSSNVGFGGFAIEDYTGYSQLNSCTVN